MDSKSNAISVLSVPSNAASTAASESAAASNDQSASASASKKRKSDDAKSIGAVGMAVSTADDALIIVTQEGDLPLLYTVPIDKLPPELLDEKFVDSFPKAETAADKLAVERIWSFLGTPVVESDDDDFTADDRTDLQTIRDASPCVKADHPVGIRKAGLVIILAGFA